MEWCEDMRGFIEPVPVEDIFITGMCKIEDVGGGVIRSWFYSEEGNTKIVRCKLVMPLTCAALMNAHGTDVFMRMMRDYPEFAQKVLRPC